MPGFKSLPWHDWRGRVVVVSPCIASGLNFPICEMELYPTRCIAAAGT